MYKDIPNLEKATALPDYKLALTFADGISGEIDMSGWKGVGVFELWNDEKEFQAFQITEDKKLQWSDDIDMDPDAFYLKLINKSFEEYARD